MKTPKAETDFETTAGSPLSSGLEFEMPPSPSDATSSEANSSLPLRVVFRAVLSRKLESTRNETELSNSLQLLLQSNTPTAVKLRRTNHPQRLNKDPDRQPFAAYFEEILLNPEFANEIFNHRRNSKIDEAFKDMVDIVGLIRQSALETKRQSDNNSLLAANRSELSELDSTAKHIAITAAGVLTVAGEISHWKLGAVDPRNPNANMLFQLPTTNSKLHFINLGDPQVALKLALNHTDSTS